MQATKLHQKTGKRTPLLRIREKWEFLGQVREVWLLQRLNRGKLKALSI